MIRRLLTALLLTLVGSGAARAEPPEELEFRVSLPTAEDRAVWQEPGFRMQLGYSFGGLHGLTGAPDTMTHTAVIRAGLQLDGPWSLYTTLRYALADGEVAGAHFAGTLEPTWHPTDRLRLAVGLGFAGFAEDRDGVRDEPDAAQRDGLAATYTYPGTTPTLPSCNGTGSVALARVEYWFVLGPLSSTGVSLQTDAQWVGCEEDLDRVEPDTARPILRRQWWYHQGWSVAWLVGWR